MQKLKIIAVGRLKEKFLMGAQQEYLKRISRFVEVEVCEIAEQRLPENPSRAQIESALKKEAAQIAQRIPAGHATAVLCIEGRGYESAEFSEIVTGRSKNRITFIIGGSFGLDEQLKKDCDYHLSFSKMTFPHHLARILLLEQIYRGYMMDSGGKYHK